MPAGTVLVIDPFRLVPSALGEALAAHGIHSHQRIEPLSTTPPACVALVWSSDASGLEDAVSRLRALPPQNQSLVVIGPGYPAEVMLRLFEAGLNDFLDQHLAATCIVERLRTLAGPADRWA